MADCVRALASGVNSMCGRFISPSHVDPLKKYITAQENHRRRETFQDEFRRLLKKYGVDYDER